MALLIAQKQRIAASTGELGHIDNIPPSSSFAQWWSHLHNLMESSPFLIWARSNHIDRSRPIEINHRDNLITAVVDGKLKSFSGFTEGYLWTSMMAPIMQAAKTLTSTSAYIYAPLPGNHGSTANYREVADFYGEAITGLTREALNTRAEELERTKAFGPARLSPERSEPVLRNAQARLAEIYNNKVASSKLINIIIEAKNLRTTRTPRGQPPTSERLQAFILDKLDKTKLTLHSDSFNSRLYENRTVSLDNYITDMGLELPKSVEELLNLGQSLDAPPLAPPPYGNFGGALSRQAPLSDADRLNIRTSLRQNTLGISGLQNYETSDGLLGYLTRNEMFSPSELNNPAKFIQTLLATPKAQALGLALQEKFDGISTPQSNNDWVLTALGLTLDSESEAGNTSSPIRTGVAGFDLARHEHWGKHPSAVVAGLAEHLVAKGKASLEMAPIAAHLLLSRRAPAFLVKDIPDKVKYGSHSWVSFTTAVARLEHEAPGATSHMTYAEVMKRAYLGPVTERERQIEQQAQWDALKDWGVANGILQLNTLDNYTDEQMSTVTRAFNEQIAVLTEASTALSSPMPERKQMALDELKRVYGDHIPFEKQCINSVPEQRDFPGPYSVLDLYLQGNIGSAPGWYWDAGEHFDFRDISAKAGRLADINARFKTELPQYFSSAEKAISTQVKHLIATLPLEDRKQIEYGKITTFEAFDVSSMPYSTNVITETKVPNTLVIKAELGGNTIVYTLNVRENTLRRWAGHLPPSLKPLTPSGSYSAGLTDEHDTRDTPKSFTSERTQYIADALVESVGMRKLADEAKGQTTFDTEVPFYKRGREFLLNLIPLRSAIVNFQAGNVKDGLIDLAFDAFGFAVALGVTAKSAKALHAGASAVSKFAHGAKILGRAALGTLNPLDGIGDIGRSFVSGAQKIWSSSAHELKVLRGLTHTTNSFDLVSASKHYDSSAYGTYRVNSQILETPAILQEGKWYAYNPRTGTAYGTPLQDFLPSAHIDAQGLGDWATATSSRSTVDEGVIKRWKSSVNIHRNGPDKEAFEQGYRYGDVTTISGARNDMTIADIMKLSAKNDLTAEQIGMLVKKYDDIAYELGRSGSARFIDRIEPRFGDVTPLPQVIYLSQTAQLSEGQCAALSRAMASAMAEGKQDLLIKNMFTAAAFPKDPASRGFISKLSRLQTQVGSQSAFQAGQPVRQVSYSQMIKELGDAQASKSVMIDSPGHAMAAGVKVDGTSKTFYFYDPNHGLATFSSAEAMQGGLDKVFNDKKLSKGYKTHSTDPKKLEFKIFDHDDVWQEKNSVFPGDLKGLYDTPIAPSAGPRSLSNVELKRNWDTLHAHPDNQGLLCREASMRVGQAEKTFSPTVYDAVKAATDLTGGSNYSSKYLELMGIKPESLKTTFAPADITESGLLNFKNAVEDGKFGHTVYIQKTSNNELFLFTTNSPDLDAAMTRSGNPGQISGGMTVHKVGDGKGLQDFLNGLNGSPGWEFAYTPASTLNANVRALQP
ncbi:hypothetical protein [Pseudomonas poae]|uniref:hypothetical protein n=1 Tax=Pseudomonas poae TaxID=200451 RepID=UPI0011B0A866|nr:hypothetical protein [Pseudomonas poae]